MQVCEHLFPGSGPLRDPRGFQTRSWKLFLSRSKQLWLVGPSLPQACLPPFPRKGALSSGQSLK